MPRVGDVFLRSSLRRGGEQVSKHLLAPVAAMLYTPDGDESEQIAIEGSSGDPTVTPITTWFDNRPELHADPLPVTGSGVRLPDGVYDCAVTIFVATEPEGSAIWFQPTIDGDASEAALRLVGPFDTVPKVFVGKSNSPTAPQIVMRMKIDEGELLGGQITNFDGDDNHAIALMALIKVA